MEVEEFHTYFVGQQQVWVHNTCKYENPGHHDPSTPGANPYNSTKSVLPKNHQDLWETSKLMPDGNRWTKEGTGKKAVYHRFQNDGNGNWHWNGSTAGKTAKGEDRSLPMQKVPTDIIKE